VVLASRAPVLLAPAMNVNMWENPITQGNLARLLGAEGAGRFTTVGPDRGPLACGWVGQGRLIEPAEILLAAQQRLAGPASHPPLAPVRALIGDLIGDLIGRRVVVTAGPTHEPIDDVRFLGNRSSGKMGFALAASAAARGARVTLIAGPVALPTPAGVAARIDIETADDLQRALASAVVGADAVVMAAAVADFRAASPVTGKLSRRSLEDGQGLSLPLAPNPDLLAELGHARRGTRPLLVGFAAEAGGGAPMVARAREKLVEKRCDIVIANDISGNVDGSGQEDAGAGAGGASAVFGADENEVTLVFAGGRTLSLPRASKLALADKIWDHLVNALAGRDPAPPTVAETTTAASVRGGR
jgi:phosphopantothenoylcysteine decarboxylase/phosphopantothenate--cysteine ligase